MHMQAGARLEAKVPTQATTTAPPGTLPLSTRAGSAGGTTRAPSGSSESSASTTLLVAVFICLLVIGLSLAGAVVLLRRHGASDGELKLDHSAGHHGADADHDHAGLHGAGQDGDSVHIPGSRPTSPTHFYPGGQQHLSRYFDPTPEPSVKAMPHTVPYTVDVTGLVDPYPGTDPASYHEHGRLHAGDASLNPFGFDPELDQDQGEARSAPASPDVIREDLQKLERSNSVTKHILMMEANAGSFDEAVAAIKSSPTRSDSLTKRIQRLESQGGIDRSLNEPVGNSRNDRRPVTPHKVTGAFGVALRRTSTGSIKSGSGTRPVSYGSASVHSSAHPHIPTGGGGNSGARPGSTAGAAAPGSKIPPCFQQVFAEMNKDNDDAVLTADEIARALATPSIRDYFVSRSFRLTGNNLQDAGTIMGALDKNGDNAISVLEFCSGLRGFAVSRRRNSTGSLRAPSRRNSTGSLRSRGDTPSSPTSPASPNAPHGTSTAAHANLGTATAGDAPGFPAEDTVPYPDDLGIKVWHEERKLLYIQSRQGNNVVCKQFNANSALVTVPHSTLRDIQDSALPSTGTVWMMTDTTSVAGDSMLPFDDYVQTVLDKAHAGWLAAKQQQRASRATANPASAGAASATGPAEAVTEAAQVRFKRMDETTVPHAARMFVVDFATMHETNYETGEANPVIRRRAGDGLALPLSLLALERAVATRAPVQLRNRGAAAARVLSVMGTTAKVEYVEYADLPTPVAAGGRGGEAEAGAEAPARVTVKHTTSVPLSDLYPLTVDLQLEEFRSTAPFDSVETQALPLLGDALGKRTFLPSPLGEESASRYVADTHVAQWQFMSGTAWQPYPPAVADRLDRLFRDPPALPQTPILQLATLRGQDKLSATECLGLQITSSHVDQSDFDATLSALSASSKRSSRKNKEVSKRPLAVGLRGLSSSESTALVDHVCVLPVRGKVSYSNDAAKPAADALVKTLNKVFGLKMSLNKGSAAGQPCAVNLVVNESMLPTASGDTLAASSVLGSARGEDDETYYIEARMVPHVDAAASAGTAAAGAGGATSGPPSCRITLHSPTVAGLKLACATVLHSTGRAATNYNNATDQHAGAIAFPACYVMDNPESSSDLQPATIDQRRVAVAVTPGAQNIEAFVESARLTQDAVSTAAFQSAAPSRAVRRAVISTREDGQLVIVKGHGLANLVSFSPGTQKATVQYLKQLPLQLAAGGGGSAAAVAAVAGRRPPPNTSRPNARTSIRSGEQTVLMLRGVFEGVESPTVEVASASVLVPPKPRSTGIDWEAALFVHEVPGSKEGRVYYFEFPSGTAAIVKRSRSPAGELAAHRLGKQLGVAMPGMAILNTLTGEGLCIVRRLQHMSHCGKVKRTSTGAVTGGLTQAPFLVVQEFLRGSTLHDIAHAEDCDAWARETFGPEGSLTAAGKEQLVALGKIIAFDVLVNNTNRWFLEGVFDSAGARRGPHGRALPPRLARLGCSNVADIVFNYQASRNAVSPIAVENQTNAYDTVLPQSYMQFTAYRERVTQLATRTYQHLGDPAGELVSPCHQAFQGVADFFLNGQEGSDATTDVPAVDYNVGNQGIRAMEQGFAHVVDAIAASPDNLEGMFQKVEASVRMELEWVTTDEAQLGASRVQAGFFAGVAKAMVAGKSRAKPNVAAL